MLRLSPGYRDVWQRQKVETRSLFFLLLLGFHHHRLSSPNIASLGALIAADINLYHVPSLIEINPIARSVVDPHLTQATTGGLNISHIARLASPKPTHDLSAGD